MKFLCNEDGCMAMLGDVPLIVYVVATMFLTALVVAKLFKGGE